MEEKLNLILSKLDNLEKNMNENFSQVNTRLDKLEEGQEALKTELKKDIKDLSGMVKTIGSNIDSEIAEVNKKLDRQTAAFRSNSAKLRELEIRVEDLEISPPVK